MRANSTRYILILHIAFWLMLFIIRYFDYRGTYTTTQVLQLMFVPNAFNILASYLHYFLILPLLDPGRKYIKYAVCFVMMMALIMWLRGETEAKMVANIFNGTYGSTYYSIWTFRRALNMVWSIGSFVLFTSLIKYTVDRFVLENERKTLENEKLNAELNYLKAQINPHFLFNTLHNLNYLTQVKSDQSTEVIIKLSNIMRYMIYDSNKTKVALHKEISYIKDYLDLERIRLNNQFRIDFDLAEVEEGVEISPLILIPFIENAFKHGVSDKYPESWIEIKLKSDKEKIFLQVKNSVFEPRDEKNEHSGFGLQNARRRLELSYPDRFDLHIDQGDKEFSVKLNIDIS